VTETQEMMLEKKMPGMVLQRKTTGARKNRVRALTGMLVAAVLVAGTGRATAQGKSKIGPAAPVTYDNRYEIYGGLSFMNFQAGQALPTRMNLGGGEVSGTYWITPRIGATAEWRGEWGTTPVNPNAFNVNRPLVYMNMGLLGAQYRGPKNQHAAINYHAYFGASHGVFDSGTTHVPAQYLPTIGLYTNRTKGIAALGGSVDFNRSKNLAVRLSPDLILEHFGTETRQFFAISAGVVYRFGKR
jgi:hypothetical protein